jgi:hypothetical protein
LEQQNAPQAKKQQAQDIIVKKTKINSPLYINLKFIKTEDTKEKTRSYLLFDTLIRQTLSQTKRVLVCVCSERERERERSRKKECLDSLHPTNLEPQLWPNLLVCPYNVNQAFAMDEVPHSLVRVSKVAI